MNDFRAKSRRRRLSDGLLQHRHWQRSLFLAAGRTFGQMILRHGRLGAQQVITVNTVQIGLFLEELRTRDDSRRE